MAMSADETESTYSATNTRQQRKAAPAALRVHNAGAKRGAQRRRGSHEPHHHASTADANEGAGAEEGPSEGTTTVGAALAGVGSASADAIALCLMNVCVNTDELVSHKSMRGGGGERAGAAGSLADCSRTPPLRPS